MISLVVFVAWMMELLEGETVVVGKNTLFQFLNSTSQIGGVSFVVESGVRISSIVGGSRLTVDKCSVDGMELKMAPFLCSSELQLSSLSLAGVERMGSLCECSGKASVLVEGCFVGDVGVRGSFLTRGVCEMERVVGSRFVNMSWVEEGEGIGEGGSGVYLGEMRNCEIKNSFDSVHGGIVAGISERSIGGFACTNSTFVGVKRERESYGVRTEPKSIGDEEFDDCKDIPTSGGVWNNKSYFGCQRTDSDGQAYLRVLLEQSLTFSFTNCTFTGCAYAGDGGALYTTVYQNKSSYTLRLDTCNFTECTGGASSSNGGGAVGAYFAEKVEVKNTLFAGCSVGGMGGSLHCESGTFRALTVIVDSCEFTKSQVTGSDGGGGAVLIFSATNVDVIGTTFSGCKSTGYGGAVCFDRSRNGSPALTLSIDSCSFTDCTTGVTSSHCGGAVGALYLSCANVTNTTVTNCSSAGSGGGLYFEAYTYFPPTLAIDQCTFTNCVSAGGCGGAIASWNIRATEVKNNSFENCSAATDGGSIWIASSSQLYNSTLSVNLCSFTASVTKGGSGGAVSSMRLSEVDVRGSSFSNCSAGKEGGCVWMGPGPDDEKDRNLNVSMKIDNCTFSDSVAVDAGGAVSANDIARAETTNSSFTNCSSSQSGGALFVNTNDTSLCFSILTENCNFTACKSLGNGGSVSARGVQKADIKNSTFSDCKASYDGGSLHLDRNTSSDPLQLTIEGCTFNGSNTTYWLGFPGGAVAAFYLTKADIIRSTFTWCCARGSGGSLFLNPNDESLTLALRIESCSFSESWTQLANNSGGAIFAKYLAASTISNTTFKDCRAPSGTGGAIWFDHARNSIDFLDTQFIDNTADSGYDIYLDSPEGVTFINCSASPCHADGTNVFPPELSHLLCTPDTPQENQRRTLEANDADTDASSFTPLVGRDI